MKRKMIQSIQCNITNAVLSETSRIGAKVRKIRRRRRLECLTTLGEAHKAQFLARRSYPYQCLSNVALGDVLPGCLCMSMEPITHALRFSSRVQ